MNSNQFLSVEMTALCRISDVPDSGGLRVVLEGLEPIAVFRDGAEYFITADECTHGSASLSEGEIFDGEIVCPYHAGTFNLRTGAASAPPCTEPLKIYEAVVRDGIIYIMVDESQ